MEHRAATSLLILLIDGWQERGIEMAPLEGPERSGRIGAFGSSCVLLTGALVHTGGCADTGIVPVSTMPGRLAIRFPAVDEHTVPG